jgi:DNA-binding response OmpR family regulator
MLSEIRTSQPARLSLLAHARPRLPGCGPTCRVVRAVPAGSSRALNIDVCDPLAHEAYAARETAVDANHAALDAYASGLRDGWREATEALAPEPRVVTTGPLVVDLAGACVTVGGQQVTLSRTEWVMLRALARYCGALVERGVLVERVWPGGQGGVAGSDHLLARRHRVLYTRMNGLRAKLGLARRLIVTHVGLGYVLLAEEPTDKDVR